MWLLCEQIALVSLANIDNVIVNMFIVFFDHENINT